MHPFCVCGHDPILPGMHLKPRQRRAVRCGISIKQRNWYVHIEQDPDQRTVWLRARRSARNDRQTALIRVVLAERVGQLVPAQPVARDEPTESVDRLTFSTCDRTSDAISACVALRRFANIPRIAVSCETPTVGGTGREARGATARPGTRGPQGPSSVTRRSRGSANCPSDPLRNESCLYRRYGGVRHDHGWTSSQWTLRGP